MGRGRQRGAVNGAGGARLVTRDADGIVASEPLLTFDPFGLGQGRTHHGTLGYPRYAAWKRERLRFQRALRARATREHLRLIVASTVARNRAGEVGR